MTWENGPMRALCRGNNPCSQRLGRFLPLKDSASDPARGRQPGARKMIRRSFLKGLSSMGLLSVMDCVGLLDQELGHRNGSLDPRITDPQPGHPGRIPPSPDPGDGVVMARLKQELSLIRGLGRMEEFRAM